MSAQNAQIAPAQAAFYRSLRGEQHEVEREIDDMLTYLALAKPRQPTGVTLHYWDVAEPQGFRYAMASARAGMPDTVIAAEERAANAASAPDFTSIASIADFGATPDRQKAGLAGAEYGLCRVSACSADYLRRRTGIRRAFSRRFVVHLATVYRDGTWALSQENFVGGIGRLFVDPHPGMHPFQDDAVRVALATHEARRRAWRVVIGWGDSPTISFTTDPIGVREVFRLRDVPEGRTRRAALRHWVREHWRQNRDGDGHESVKVREHLRGATEFAWNGLRCQIVPSAIDLERATSANVSGGRCG